MGKTKSPESKVTCGVRNSSKHELDGFDQLMNHELTKGMAVDSNVTSTLNYVVMKVIFIFYSVNSLEVVIFVLYFLISMVFFVATSNQ
jgi:hypothetical protein